MLVRPTPARPAIPLALAALSGAVLGPLLPGWSWLTLLALPLACAPVARRRCALACLLLACGAGFGLRARVVAERTHGPVEPLRGGGWIEVALVDVQPAPHGRARLLAAPVEGGARLELDVPAVAARSLLPGARLAALATPTRPLEPRTAARLLRQGVGQRLRAEVLIEHSPGRGGRALLCAAERAGRDLIERAAPPERAAFLRTVLLGDRSSLGPALQEAFRDTGTVHLLSISGLHVGLVAGLLLSGGRLVGLPRRERRLGAALGILLYAALAGAGVPVLRSALAGLVVCCAPGRGDPWNRLAVGLLLVLAWDPASPWDVDLQLSFGVTAAILALAPPLSRRLVARRGRGRASTALSSWSAGALVPFLASTPLIWACLGQVSLASLLANALAVPLCSLVLGLGLLGILVGAPLPGLGLLLLSGADLATAGLFRLLELLAALPAARVDLVRPAPWAAVVAAGLVAIGALRREAGRPCWWAFALAALLLLPAPLPDQSGRPSPPRLLVRRGGGAALVAGVGPLARSLGPPPRDGWQDEALRRLGCAAIEPGPSGPFELAPGLRCEPRGKAWLVRQDGLTRPLLLLAPRLGPRELSRLLASEPPLAAVVRPELALPAGVRRLTTDHDDLLVPLGSPP